MWKTTRSNEIVANESHHDLIWSLQPIIYGMRVFGIDLNMSLPVNCFRLFALVSFASLMALNCSSYPQMSDEPIDKTSAKSTMVWLDFLKPFTWFIFNIGFLLAMLEMATLFKWKPLWDTLKRLDNNMRTFHWQLRKLSAVLTIFFIILASQFNNKMISWTVFYSFLSQGLSLRVIVSWKRDYVIESMFGMLMIDLYIYFAVILFVCLTCSASLSIQTIIVEVQNHFPPLRGAVIAQLMKWKQNYFLISSYVELIDRFFGMFLFVFLAKLFVTFFIFSFCAVIYWHNNDSSNLIHMVCFFIKYGTLLALIFFGCETMKKQVSSLTKYLRESSQYINDS